MAPAIWSVIGAEELKQPFLKNKIERFFFYSKNRSLESACETAVFLGIIMESDGKKYTPVKLEYQSFSREGPPISLG